MRCTQRAQGINYAIRQVTIPAQELERKGITVTKMNIGDPNKWDFCTPEYVRHALCEAVEHVDNGYEDSAGNIELRETIHEWERRKSGAICDLDDIVVTAGVSESIQTIIAATIDHGDEILVPNPGYPSYDQYIKFFGGVPVPYGLDEGNSWQPDPDDIRSKISDRTKAIVMINPNNPTGAVYSERVLGQVADVVAEHDMFIMSDEIYDRIAFEGAHQSMASIRRDVPKILMNGFSKVNIMPGWRLGYSMYLDPNGELDEIKEGMMRQLRLRLSANTPCQQAVISALRGPQGYLKEMNDKLRSRAHYSATRLNEIPGLSTVKPKGAFYIFPKIDSNVWTNGMDFVMDVLHEEHILFVPGSGFGEEIGGMHFRSVFLPPIDVLEGVFDRLDGFMRRHHQE